MHKPLVTFAAVFTLSASCVEERRILDPSFCTNARGDETCAERYPDGSRPYCVIDQCLNANHGCFPFEPTEECASPCGMENPDCAAGMTTEGSGSGSGTESTTEGSESGSESGSTTGPQPCSGDGDCTDAGAPFCEPSSGECVACDGMDDPDGACAGLDPGMPLCVGGACVQCTAAAPEACTGATPVCDDATNTCIPCTAHEQCGEAACNLFTGACLPGDAVVRVGPGQDHATLAAAVGSFAAGAEGTIVVHQANYDEPVTVDGGRVLALLANPGDTPIWILAGGGSPQLEVTDGTVLIDGLRLSGNADDRGLVVTGGRAWVDRSRIVDNNGGGILAETSAEVMLRNCFVGQAVSNVDALAVNDASATVLYSTLVGAYNAAALECTMPQTVEVRNSILVTEGGTPPDEVACSSATITYSATEGVVMGDGNASVGGFPAGMAADWFVNYSSGNYSLQNEGLTLFADVASWTTGDPPTDIEGDLRPTIDGTSDHAGADVP